MGNIRNFKAIRNVVLYFDYYYNQNKYFLYKVMQFGGKMIFPFILLARYKEYCKGKTLYPECEIKSSVRIFFDQLGWCIRKGELNNFYYLLGMDRKSAGRIWDYIGEVTWTNARRKKNEVRKQWKSFNASALLLDKFYFGALLETLGYNTPHIKYIVNNAEVIDIDNKCPIEFCHIFSDGCEYFFKNTLGGGGKDLDNFVIKMSDGQLYKLGEPISSDDLYDIVKRGRWIIQDRITNQHYEMAKFHEHSINTVRLVTVLHDGEVIPIAALARFGQNNRMKDNGFSGGIIVPIDVETGIMQKYGLMPKSSEKTAFHPNSNLEFFESQVPLWDIAISKAKALHKQFYNIHSIGWDIAFLEDDVCFIEANDDWHVIDAQVLKPGKDIYQKYFR